MFKVFTWFCLDNKIKWDALHMLDTVTITAIHASCHLIPMMTLTFKG